jgi:signal recognition particle subunit SRP54
MIQKMGPLKEIVGKMPGMSDMIPADADLDDRELVRIEAMISSFTRFERGDPYALVREPTRVTRIAKGSGTPEKAVSELVQKFLFMRQMMEGIGNMGMLGKIPGMKSVKMAKNLKRQMAQGGGMPSMSSMMGMPGLGLPGMPGMGLPGMGTTGFPGLMGGDDEAPGSLTKMKSLTTAEKNAKKAQRKREKDARRKSRR